MPLSSYESVFFWIFGITAIFAGLLTVMAKNAVHSALFLISSLVSVAALFVLSGAEFIAGVQILVYVGGVMVLFLFVIMSLWIGVYPKPFLAFIQQPVNAVVKQVRPDYQISGMPNAPTPPAQERAQR